MCWIGEPDPVAQRPESPVGGFRWSSDAHRHHAGVTELEGVDEDSILLGIEICRGPEHGECLLEHPGGDGNSRFTEQGDQNIGAEELELIDHVIELGIQG